MTSAASCVAKEAVDALAYGREPPALEGGYLGLHQQSAIHNSKQLRARK